MGGCGDGKYKLVWTRRMHLQSGGGEGGGGEYSGRGNKRCIQVQPIYFHSKYQKIQPATLFLI